MFYDFWCFFINYCNDTKDVEACLKKQVKEKVLMILFPLIHFEIE